MQSIKLRSHVGSDGILHLEIPLDIADKEIEVMVIYQQLEPSAQAKTTQNVAWPSSFFEHIYDIYQDDPIVIDSKGDSGVREEIL